VNGMTIRSSGVPGAPGSRIVSLMTWPVRLISTRIVPLTDRPSRPISAAVPVAKIANVSSVVTAGSSFAPASFTTPTVAPVTSTPMASGLTLPSALRYGPAPRNSSTFLAP
jgi:hypothetical protein